MEAQRRTLIYLYKNGFDNNNKILLELLQKNKKITLEDVEKWFKDNNINENDYYTILDKDYPRELYKWEDAPYVIEKVVYESKVEN